MKTKDPTGYQRECSLCGRFVRTKIPKDGDGSMVVPWRHKTDYGARCMGHLHEAVEIGKRKVTEIPQCPFCGSTLVVHRILNPGGEMYYCDCAECMKFIDKYGVRYGHTRRGAIERVFDRGAVWK